MVRNALDVFMESLGYRVIHGGTAPIHECLLECEDEVWLGHGSTPDAALGDAVRRAFPSRAARQLLDAAMLAHDEALAVVDALPGAGEQSSLGLEKEPAGDGPEPASSEPGSTEEATVATAVTPVTWGFEGGAADAAVKADELQPRVQVLDQNQAAPDNLYLLFEPVSIDVELGADAEPGDAPAAPDQDGVVATAIAPLPVEAVPAPTPAGDESARAQDREALVRAVLGLGECIDAQRAHVAGLAPHRQRLAILQWHALVRAAQDGHVGVPESIVADLIGKLRAMVATWWPGNIDIMRLAARPWDAYGELRDFVPEAHPMTWEEVARDAERALLAAEEQDRQRGRDADGWADNFPVPLDPDLELQLLIEEVEDQGGPLGPQQPKEAVAPPEPAVLLDWAQRLRWVRGRADREVWGAVAGRLRFWVWRSPSQYAEAKQALDPKTKPPRAWGQIVRERRQKPVDLDAVLDSVPQAGAHDKALRRWLKKALAAQTPDTIGQIAEVSKDCGFNAPKRLALLRVALGLDPKPEPAENPPKESPGASDSGAPEPSPALPKTRGLRALLVSNRADEALRLALLERFEFASLDLIAASNGRLRSAADAIVSGRYDLVMVATGFVSHSQEEEISDACASSGVSYLRVEKGRPGAVERYVMAHLIPVASASAEAGKGDAKSSAAGAPDGSAKERR